MSQVHNHMFTIDTHFRKVTLGKKYALLQCAICGIRRWFECKSKTTNEVNPQMLEGEDKPISNNSIR